jgi:hypothetical protein
MHPHVPSDRHALPACSARHPPVRSALHSTHARRAGSHTSGGAQSPSPRHCSQRRVCGSQRRSAPLVHVASVVQLCGGQTPTPPDESLQAAPPGQALRPDATLQPGRQIPAAPLHTRPEVGPPHSPSPSRSVQPHAPISVRHTGRPPPHKRTSAAEHSTHAPRNVPSVAHTGHAGSVQNGAPLPAHGSHRRVAGSQYGRAPPHSAFSLQAAHTKRSGKQVGTSSGQSASSRHPTHTPPRQNGRSLPQRRRSPSLHSVQAPERGPSVWHTGRRGSEQTLGSVPHATHTRVTGSQRGVDPPQSVCPRQPTHTPSPTAQ